MINDGTRRKCDCLFILKKTNKTYVFLVELKGRNHLESAFEQLALTREYQEYQNIIGQLSNVQKRFVIISDTQLNKSDLAKLEDTYNIRVGSILHSEPQSPIPDLREKI